jgi:hypothetical protein
MAFSGCADTQTSDVIDPDDQRTSAHTEEELQRRLEVRQRAMRQYPEQVAQPQVDHVRTDLAEQLGISADDLSVLKGQSITWNDGSLGCGKPGEIYTQATVPGYWILLVHDGREYDYRASERGYFFLCELPRSIERRQELQ